MLATQLPEDKHWWFHSRTQALFSVLDPFFAEPGLVLDVGSGAGNMAHHLSRYGRVIGVDHYWKPLQKAWERGLCALPAEAVALPFAPDTFTLVALLDVIEHCPDDAAVLAESFRVCKPGGLVVITTPAFSWLWSHNDVANQHLRRYTKGQLRQLLAQAGFRMRRLSYTYTLVFPAAAGLVLLRRLTGIRTKIATPQDDDAYQVEMEAVPPLINSVLFRLGDAEARLLRDYDLGLGTSVLAVAEKPC